MNILTYIKTSVNVLGEICGAPSLVTMLVFMALSWFFRGNFIFSVTIASFILVLGFFLKKIMKIYKNKSAL